MGGFGSGRYGGRQVTADYRRLDVRHLQRAGVLTPGWNGGWGWYRNNEERDDIRIRASATSLRLRYTTIQLGKHKQHDYTVNLSRTRCHYGGERPWFLCPSCGRRVAILYGGAVFACRHCYRLAYQVQHETDNDRTIRKVDAIRARLGWEPGFLNGAGWKPKEMHWRTFRRLTAQHHALIRTGLEGAMTRLRR